MVTYPAVINSKPMSLRIFDITDIVTTVSTIHYTQVNNHGIEMIYWIFVPPTHIWRKVQSLRKLNLFTQLLEVAWLERRKKVQLDIENLNVLIKRDTELRQTNILPVHCTDLNTYKLVVKNRNVTTLSLNRKYCRSWIYSKYLYWFYYAQKIYI